MESAARVLAFVISIAPVCVFRPISTCDSNAIMPGLWFSNSELAGGADGPPKVMTPNSSSPYSKPKTDIPYRSILIIYAKLRYRPQTIYFRMMVVDTPGSGAIALITGWGKRWLRNRPRGIVESKSPSAAACMATIAFSQKACGGRRMGRNAMRRILKVGGMLGPDRFEIEAGKLRRLSP